MAVQTTGRAFPKAYGAGSSVTGGSGGTVYHVTNLNNSGTGSFRDAVSASNRIIVFDVSGTCQLTSTLNITSDNLTIAGQTAPLGGFTICGNKNVTFLGANNIIMRYIKFRFDYTTVVWGSADALDFKNCDGTMVDHCSVSWGADEVFSLTGTNNNITIQRSIFNEGKTGSIFGDSDDATKTTNFSIFNNLWYNVPHRTPNINSNSRYDYINNVVFNWKNRLSRISGAVDLNYINNYLSLGNLSNITSVGNMIYGGAAHVYIAGNYVNKSVLTDPSADNWFLVQDFNGGAEPQVTASTSYKASPFVPFALIGEPITIQTAIDAFSDVTTDCGANATLDGSGNIVLGSDVIDTACLTNTANNTPQTYDHDEPADYDATAHWSTFWSSVSTTPLATRSSYYNPAKSNDIPETWYDAQGLTTELDTDLAPSGYTWMEEFLNSVDGVISSGNIFHLLTNSEVNRNRHAKRNTKWI